MKISTKGRYALRIMLDIAIHDTNEYISVKDISKRQDITTKYMEQIISQLNKAGLLKSFRGSSGGYKLSKKPKEYTVGEILCAIEGNLAPVTCLEYIPNQCKRCNECITLPLWGGLYKVIQEYLDNVTLENLLNNKHEI